MATEGPRRSTRVRTQVKSYADEQAEERDNAVKAKAPKGKRKSIPDDGDDEARKPAKKTKRAAKSTDANDDATASNVLDNEVNKGLFTPQSDIAIRVSKNAVIQQT